MGYGGTRAVLQLILRFLALLGIPKPLAFYEYSALFTLLVLASHMTTLATCFSEPRSQDTRSSNSNFVSGMMGHLCLKDGVHFISLKMNFIIGKSS